MILITGATGLSGKIIVNEFAAQNIPVRVLARHKQRAIAFKDLNTHSCSFIYLELLQV
ncbi:MAG: NmrA family NAD(P)-binding protein [Ferruginibacter sp.]